MTIVQHAWHYETVLKVAHWMRAKGHPPSLCVGYCEGVRKKWEEASARGDSDFDLSQAVKKVDEDSNWSFARVLGCWSVALASTLSASPSFRAACTLSAWQRARLVR